jgi:hypothetical protein
MPDGLPTFWLTYTSSAAHIFFILTTIIAATAIVRPLFKRNIYLSLLCDWIFSLSTKSFSFSFSSKYAVEACDINTYC